MEQDNFFAEVELKGQFVESGKNILSMYHFNFTITGMILFEFSLSMLILVSLY